MLNLKDEKLRLELEQLTTWIEIMKESEQVSASGSVSRRREKVNVEEHARELRGQLQVLKRLEEEDERMFKCHKEASEFVEE